MHWIYIYTYIQLYADDIEITYSTGSVKELNIQMQEDIDTLRTSFEKNMLLINARKTIFITYRNKNLNNETFKIRYDRWNNLFGT